MPVPKRKRGDVPRPGGHLRIAKLLTTAGLLLLGRSAFAQEVRYDYDKNADFHQIRTYAWAGEPNLKDELNHRRIVDAIDAQLRAKSVARVDSTADPDVYVVYRVGITDELEISGTGGRYVGRWPSSARVEKVALGTLTVGIVDARTGTVVWHGSATKELDASARPEKREKNIAKAVEKLFKHYPPGA